MWNAKNEQKHSQANHVKLGIAIQKAKEAINRCLRSLETDIVK